MTPTPETLRMLARDLDDLDRIKSDEANALFACADAWEALIKQIEGLTAGGSEYVNDPSRCLEEVHQRLKIAGHVAAERNALRAQLAASEQARQRAEKDCRWLLGFAQRQDPFDSDEDAAEFERISAALARAKEKPPDEPRCRCGAYLDEHGRCPVTGLRPAPTLAQTKETP